MNPETLLDQWSKLPIPDGVRYLEAAETSSDSLIWFARGPVGDYHLLVLVPDGSEISAHTTKGLTVDVKRHRIPEWGAGDCIDLLCTEESTLSLFAAVAYEVIKELEDIAPEYRTAVVTETLARWRWFWGVDTAGLSDSDALGLFGELWFLDQWVGATRENVLAWGGDDQTRHDFQWAERSVEVKSTARRGDGATIHTVQHLDQLSPPESGNLYLFSLRVTRDRLATNTLAPLASRCSEQLQGASDARHEFLRKLSRRGYSPADSSVRETGYRILDEQIYEVSDRFPRLEPASFVRGLPAGVVNVSYKIDLTACERWRLDREHLAWLGQSRSDS